MTATDINEKLWIEFANFEYRLYNVFVFQNESDFLAVSKSGYVWEVEVKISRGDFFNDFKKMDWGGKNKHDKLLSEEHKYKPHKFCFAVPEGLVTKEEVPPYAGLIYVNKNGCYFPKMPKFLHKENLFDNKKFLKQLLNKFYYRHMDLREALKAREWEIQYKQKRIEFNRW